MSASVGQHRLIAWVAVASQLACAKANPEPDDRAPGEVEVAPAVSAAEDGTTPPRTESSDTVEPEGDPLPEPPALDPGSSRGGGLFPLVLAAHAVLEVIGANEASDVPPHDVGETEQSADGDPDSQLDQVDPFQDLDRDKLTSLGIELDGAALVSTTAELRAAVAPGKTIVLRSGTYDLGDEDDAMLGKTSGLTLVGMGTEAPILRRSNPARAVLTLDGVSDVTLHHIRLQRDETSVKATAPTLRVSHANNVRLLRAELRGSSERAFDLVDVTGFELRNVTAYGHHGGIANLVDATDLTFAKVDFWTRQHLATGFGLLRSKLELLECRIRRHDAFGGTLFDLAPAPERIATLDPHGRSRVKRADSEVTLVKTTLTENRFERLATPYEKLVVISSPFDDLQFEDASRAGARGWWCECHRERTDTGFTPVTVCHASPKRCEEETTRIERGPTSTELAASVMRPCRATYGRQPSDELGAVGRWSSGPADTQRVSGQCLPTPRPGAGPIAPPAAQLPEPAAGSSVPWTNLLPVRQAKQSGSRVDVIIPTENAAIDARYPMLALEGGPTLTRGHPTLVKLAPELESLPEPWLVTTKGVTRAKPFVSAKLVGTLVDGNWWFVRHPREGLRDPLVALSGEPSSAARLRAAPRERSVPPHHPAVRAASLALGRRDARWLETEPGVTQSVQIAEGRFPGGATHIATVIWTSPDMEMASGPLFTLDDKGELVQSIGGAPSLWSAAAILEFLGDIDGDGFDEVGWSSQGIEDITESLTRLTPSEVRTHQLFAAGH